MLSITSYPYKILITTSGTGSRLKALTKDTNKSLIQINNKAIISYIVESYPTNIEMVITLGFKGEQVEQYLTSNFPDRKFTFVTVSPFEGDGSSLGYSMLQAKEFLDCPFIFHCNDTIVQGKIPNPISYNWSGGSLGNDPALFNTYHYSSFKVDNDKITKIQSKGADTFDYFHIGLVGIKDYEAFWNELEVAYKANTHDQTLNDVTAINTMLQKHIAFKPIPFTTWCDTGNLEGLENAKKILEKTY